MMFLLFFLLFFLITGIYIYEMHQFNHSATLIQLQNPNSANMNDILKEKSPLIVHNLSGKFLEFENLTISHLVKNNPGYIIKDNNKHILLSSFKDDTIDQIHVLNNSNMVHDFNLQDSFIEISKYFTNKLSCNLKSELSILKGNYSISLLQNKHNIQLLFQLSGNTTFYIFNPKHKEEIQNKSNSEIKKWAFKINLKPGILLCLPPDWYSIYEIEGESILGTITFDNYLTWGYNLLR